MKRMFEDCFKFALVLFLTTGFTFANPYSQTECNVACLNADHDNNKVICQACATDPPLGLEMCAVACKFPNKPFLAEIAEKCAVAVPLTDKMCIVSCMNYFLPYFMKICRRCRVNPPVTGDMCIYACDNYQLLSQVCIACTQNTPKDKKLCEHACKRTRNPSYHHICSDCKYKEANEPKEKRTYQFRPGSFD